MSNDSQGTTLTILHSKLNQSHVYVGEGGGGGRMKTRNGNIIESEWRFVLTFESGIESKNERGEMSHR